jgi:hypothetical protein
MVIKAVKMPHMTIVQARPELSRVTNPIHWKRKAKARPIQKAPKEQNAVSPKVSPRFPEHTVDEGHGAVNPAEIVYLEQDRVQAERGQSQGSRVPPLWFGFSCFLCHEDLRNDI